MEIDEEQDFFIILRLMYQLVPGLELVPLLNVGFITTISSQSQSMLETAEIAYQFEALLGNKGGRQDQWASAFDINHLTFTGDNVSVKPIEVSSEFSNWLEQHLLLFNSHITHVSGDLHKSV